MWPVSCRRRARALTGWQPELCLNLHGGTRSMTLALRSGARFRAGFAHHRHSFLYNVPIPAAQEILGVARKVHTAEHLASAMFYLGAARCEISRAKLYAGKTQPGRDSLRCAAPGGFGAGQDLDGRGIPRRGTALARERGGLEPVFIGAASEELGAFAEHRAVAGAPLADVKTLMAGASVFVGNDSGPAHMAAAFGVPQVVIFGNSDAEVWAPVEGDCRDAGRARADRLRPARRSDRRARTAQGGGVKELGRLLRFVGPYWWAVIFSSILMAIVGAAHGMTAILVGKIFTACWFLAGRTCRWHCSRFPS